MDFVKIIIDGINEELARSQNGVNCNIREQQECSLTASEEES
jgi:hypothetical protein